MKHAVVIGAGFGGIAAALRARAKGWQVTLIDRAPMLGGRAQVFEREGFRHDAGPTVITAPFLFEELFTLFGEQLQDHVSVVPLKPWYRFIFDDLSTFDYGGSFSETLAEIQRVCPEDVTGYQRLLQTSKAIYEIGFERLADKPFHKFRSMLATMPHLLRLRAHRSVWKLVSSHLTSEKLRQAFSIQPLLVGGNPFDTTCIYALIHFLERAHGVHFCMGGTGALVQALEGLMRRQGIKIRLNKSVSRIIVEKNEAKAVELDGGEYIQADAVISNVDPAHLYEKMLARNESKMSARIKTRFARKSMGLFVVYFGANRQWKEVAHHTIVLGPRYKGLLDDIFYKKRLAEDMSIYLHRPTATDPSMAPENHDAFYVLVPVPNNLSGINWKEKGDSFKELVIEKMEKTTLPNLRENIVSDFYLTPDYFEQELSTLHGSGFSIQPKFTQSAYFRFHNQSEIFSNMFFVGAGTHPGAGMPGVLSSAKVLDKLL